MVQLLWKTAWWLPQKWKTELTHNSAIPLLGLHPPKKYESKALKRYCTPRFIATLFTKTKSMGGKKILKHRNNHPLMDEWLSKMECDSAWKRQEILTHGTTWMTFKDIMLSEISQSQKDKYCIIPLRWAIQSSQNPREREKMVIARGWGRGKGSQCVMGTEFQFWKMRNRWRWIVVMTVQQHECS